MKPFNFITLSMAIITLWCGRFWCDSDCNGGHCPANSGRPRTLLAAGGLQLFARYSKLESSVSVELSPDATVKDLYERIAERIGVRADQFSVSFQGQTLHDRNAAIADTGISSEAVVDVERELTPFEMLSHLLDSMDVVGNPPAEIFPNQKAFRNFVLSVKGGQVYSDEQLCSVLELLIKCDDQQRITWISVAYKRVTGILNIRYIPKSVTYFDISGNALEAIVFTGISDDMELETLRASYNKNLQLRIEGQENIAKLKKLKFVVIDGEHEEKVQDPLRAKFTFA